MTAGLDPGRVRLRLAAKDGRIARADILSERPDVAPRLVGRSVGEAVRLVPLLFALCGAAQGRAAQLALAAARGEERAAHLDAGVAQEVMREHLWRWLLDLPSLLGATPLRQEFVAAARALAEGGEALAVALAAPGIEALRNRLMTADDLHASPARHLPALDARASLDEWPCLDSGFCRQPQWRGDAAETGALARRAALTGEVPAPAFAARWRARFDELHDAAAGRAGVGAGGTASSACVSAGRGRALVETARGLLMHEIAVADGRVLDYRIVAPTEWNFHPRGTLASWLRGRDAASRDALEVLVARAVAALDPCVGWQLEWL